jgi:hypothetical protein
MRLPVRSSVHTVQAHKIVTISTIHRISPLLRILYQAYGQREGNGTPIVHSDQVTKRGELNLEVFIWCWLNNSFSSNTRMSRDETDGTDYNHE